MNFLAAAHPWFTKQFWFLLVIFLPRVQHHGLAGRDQAFSPELQSCQLALQICSLPLQLHAYSQSTQPDSLFRNALIHTSVLCKCAIPNSSKARLASCVFDNCEGDSVELVTFFSSYKRKNALVQSVLFALQYFRICEAFPAPSLLSSGVVSLLLWWWTEMDFLKSATERVRGSIASTEILVWGLVL